MSEVALQPTLTAFDLRVLKVLDDFDFDAMPRKRPDFKSAWAIAEALAFDEIGQLRQILNGLERFGYVTARDFGPRREWLRTPAGTAALGEKRRDTPTREIT